MFLLLRNSIERTELLKNFLPKTAGALVEFSGVVRNHNEGKQVTALEYEAYDDLCKIEATKIIREAQEKFQVDHIIVAHRVGLLKISECAVWIAVASSHREQAYLASRYLIDEIKLRLPIWKKEYYVDEQPQWVSCQGCLHHVHHHFAPEDYYAKQKNVAHVGIKGQKRLTESRVAVVGAGGLGCPVLLSLCQAGVGYIRIIDHDRVDITNLHRQNLYFFEEIGERKAEIAQRKLQRLNPFIKIEARDQKVEWDNLSEHLADVDLVLDCTDNFRSKFLIHDYCLQQSIPVIQASVHQQDGQVMAFHIHRESGCLRCLWPEMPQGPQFGNCDTYGVLGVLTQTLGSVQASEALQYLLGQEPVTAHYQWVFDRESLESVKIRRQQNPECRFCSDSLFGTQPLKKQDYGLKDFELYLFDREPSFWQTAQFIDIRSQEEQQRTPEYLQKHLINGTHIDKAFVERTQNAPIVLVCQKGIRSREKAQHLRQYADCDHVYSLAKGLSDIEQLVKQGMI